MSGGGGGVAYTKGGVISTTTCHGAAIDSWHVLILQLT